MNPLPLLCALLLAAPAFAQSEPPHTVICHDGNGNIIPCGGGVGAPISPPPGQDDELERQRQAEEARKIKEALEEAKKKAAAEAEKRRREETRRTTAQLLKGAEEARRAKEIGDAMKRRVATGSEFAMLVDNAERKLKELIVHPDVNWSTHGLPIIQVRGRAMMTRPDGTIEPIDRGATAILGGDPKHPGKGPTIETGPDGRFDSIPFEGYKLLVDKKSKTTMYRKRTIKDRLKAITETVIDLKEGVIRWIHDTPKPPPSAPPRYEEVFEPIINTSDWNVTPYGTDFWLKVDANGAGEIAIFEGSVGFKQVSTGKVFRLTGPRSAFFTKTSFGPAGPLDPRDYDVLQH